MAIYSSNAVKYAVKTQNDAVKYAVKKQSDAVKYAVKKRSDALKFAVKYPELAALTKKILSEHAALLITAGGETSCGCLEALNMCNLEIQAGISPAIPLFRASNGQFAAVKSGNLGTDDIFIQILKYLEQGNKG